MEEEQCQHFQTFLHFIEHVGDGELKKKERTGGPFSKFFEGFLARQNSTKEFNTLELKWREEILHSLCRAATENHTAGCRPAEIKRLRSISTYVNDR